MEVLSLVALFDIVLVLLMIHAELKRINRNMRKR